MTQHAQQQVVVVTGASGGIGRATAIAFGARGAAVALLARGESGLHGAAKEVEAAGGRALVVPVDVADADAVERAAATVEDAARADRRLGQRRLLLGVRAVLGDRREGVRPRDRGQLPRLRLRDDVRAVADARAGPRGDRAGGLGPGLPRHPAADRLLRLQARDPGLPRGPALRAAARAQRRARDDGPDAGGQHPAVLLAAVTAAPAGAAGAPDLPAGGRRQGRAVRRGPPAATGVLGRWQHAAAPWSPTRSRRACWTATWPGPASPPNRPTSPRTPTSRPTSGSRSTRDRDFGTRGRFDDRSTARSLQLWASQHHGLLAVLAGGAAAGTAGRGPRRTPLTTRGFRREAAVRRTTCTGAAPGAGPRWRRPRPGTTAAPAVIARP